MISLTIDRTALGLADLVFSTPDSGLWVDEEGLTYPTKRWRRQYADSDNLHGSALLRATLDHASIAGTLYVQAADTAALRVRRLEVEDAFGQFFYPVTITEDGVSVTHSADPADLEWGAIDSGMTKAYLAVATVTIPVYPVGA